MDIDLTSQTVQQKALVAVYIHIPKSGGSTLRSILSQNYAPDRALELNGILGEQKCREFSESYARIQPDLVYGHHPFGVHDLLRRPWLYFTLLRNPIDRLVSEYYYAFQYDEHRFAEEIRSGQLTLEKFVMLDHWFTSNRLVTFVSGLREIDPHQILETAKLNLRERFASFGIMEQFDDSVLIMASELGWDRPLYVKRNVTKRQPHDIGRDLRARIEKMLETDMELYEYGRSLFRKRLEQQPRSFYSAREEYVSKTSEIGQEYSHLIHTEFDLTRGNDLTIDRFYESIPDINRYLKETREGRSHPRCLGGMVEKVSLQSVSGWSVDSDAPPQILEVLMGVDDRTPVRIRADRPRPDLADQGFSALNHGFAFDFDPVLDETRPHTLKLFHAETTWPLVQSEWKYSPGGGWRCIGIPRSQQSTL